MPPPLNPQGNRAGLITAVVVLSILFVTSAIFAFYYNAEANRQAGNVRTLNDKLNQYANNEAQGDPAVQALVENKGDQSAIQAAVTQLRTISRAVTGQENTNPTAAQQEIARLMQAASTDEMKAAGVTVAPTSSVSELVTQLSNRVRGLVAEVQDKNEQLAAATTRVQEGEKARAQMQTAMDEKFATQGQQLADAMSKLEASRNQGTQSVGKVQAETTRALGVAQKQLSDLQQQLAARDTRIGELQKEIETVRQTVARQGNVGESVIRQADGRVIRVPGNNNVFINLGLGDGITPGMTFEVYDRFAGVPAPGNDDDQAAAAAPIGAAAAPTLPRGKASVEVVRLAQGQSECRIARQSLGQPVVEGDVIANLVYDRNTKYSFVVFGDFDLDQNGTPTPGDTEVVRRLITQWGGRLQTDVNVSTDFVVLGAEPEVPVAEENEDPAATARRGAAAAQLEAYNDVVTRAKSLNIPILNQNRFLYYVGYYEQAKR